MATAYVMNDDLFSAASVRNARAVDDQVRETAAVVKLARENITMLARYEHVSEGLRDWKTFSSTSRPWHDPNSVRPEILLTDDPPRHTASAGGDRECAIAAGACRRCPKRSARTRMHWCGG